MKLRPSGGWLTVAVLAAAAALAGTLAGCATTAVGNTAVNGTEAARYNLALGVAYLRQGNLALAKTKLERAREQNPDDAQIRYTLALLYDRLGDDKDAQTEFRAAEHIAPKDPDVINNYAVYLCRKGQTDQGVRRFEQAAANKLYATPWAAYTNAGVCLNAAGRHGEAMTEFERALAVRPSFGEAMFQLASLEYTQGHYAQAQARIDGYLRDNGATADLLLLGWRTAAANHDPAAAIRFGLRLRQEFPKSEQAQALTAPAGPGTSETSAHSANQG